MAARRTIYGFGFEPETSPHHFAVVMNGQGTRIEERRHWQTNADYPVSRPPSVKVKLDAYRWRRIAETAGRVFNDRLRQERRRTAEWNAGETVLAPHFGKELTLLAWAVEGADPTLIPNIVANWLGLAPEERWWLYTTINATSDRPDFGPERGWRKAIRIAFTENPADVLPPSTLLAEPPPPREAANEVASVGGRRRVARRTPSPAQGTLPLDLGGMPLEMGSNE
jgi:hypothetical protein